MSVERLNPNALTFDEALELGHVIARSFSEDRLFRHVAGELMNGMDLAAGLTSTPTLGLSGINGPKERADKAAYDLIATTWARCVYQLAHTPGIDIYRVLDKQGATVGVAMWRYPEYMWPQLEYDLDRTGWLFWFKRLYVSLRMAITHLIKFKLPRRENPVFNARLAKFSADRRSVFLSKMTDTDFYKIPPSEIDGTLYPEKFMLYLMVFGVLPQCRGLGYGKKLLQASLDTIPNTKLRTRNKLYPQKIHLEATDDGYPLYLKHGFEPINEHYNKAIGYHSTYMILKR
ncbi:hypothetical protein TRICI_004422 [Trichomonascus ciferrii]|uniref:N-acetyltransferase domain-containing protein n=1 Tax=Trichomonascus ciferrii TaxID=44093 RepID=A0A642V0J7_9ASCO|nr:hypothetical protein TRICI_004422 [Trichomonascus ciferrii]